MQKQEAAKQAEQSLMQMYANMCAELGERTFQKELLEREIQGLLGKIGQASAALREAESKKGQPIPAAAPAVVETPKEGAAA